MPVRPERRHDCAQFFCAVNGTARLPIRSNMEQEHRDDCEICQMLAELDALLAFADSEPDIFDEELIATRPYFEEPSEAIQLPSVPQRVKYALLEVPNFNGAALPEDQMSSYLRLGAVKDVAIAGQQGAPRDTGEDLAALVQDFADDKRKRRDEDNECPTYVQPDERVAETSLLHTKGGWRDHSDGNRISTTRGDKVEVIRGNYRMLILGRRDDTDHQAGWDASGGHLNESSTTFDSPEEPPLGESRIEWVKNYDGTWRIVEHTKKGDVFSTYHGDTHDWYWGNIKESITGSEEPEPGKENPKILDRTWAERITSYTGSLNYPVPKISDTTHALEVSSHTYARRMTDETHAGTISSLTVADEINSITRGTVSDRVEGDSRSTIIGSESEMIIGNVTEMTVGTQVSLTCGAVVDVTLAAMLEVCLALKLEIDLGLSIEVNADKKIRLCPNELGFKATDVSFHQMKTIMSKMLLLP